MSAMNRALKKMKKDGKKKKDLLSLQKQLIKDYYRIRTRSRISLVGAKCKICGTTQNLTRHHLSFKPMRVIILCRKCHDEIEGMR